jgi:hypothetical protein
MKFIDDEISMPAKTDPFNRSGLPDPRNRDEKQIAALRRLMAGIDSVRIGQAPPATEVRTVDPTTGGEKGAKLARFSLIPSEFLWALAEHFGKGAQKYADRNWERGYKWSLTVDALNRHLHQFLQGERYDTETGSHHLIAVAWHAMALFVFDLRRIGTNDVTPNQEETRQQ